MGNYSCCQDDDDYQNYNPKKSGSSHRISSDDDFRSSSNSIFINQQFQQGKIYLEEGRYKEALEKFIIVSNLEPNFPEIQYSIILAAVLLKAVIIYENGIALYQQCDYKEALKRFEYIENELCPDFRQCRALIEDCRTKILQIYLAQQIQNQYERVQAEQLIKEFYALLLAAHQRQQSEEVISQPQHRQVRADSINKEEPKFDESSIEKIEIYYECFKTPKCITNNSIPFKHAQCGTKAYLNVDGFICCQRNCKTYYIGEALFNCSNRQVIERSNNVNLANYEFIRDTTKYADFVESCLKMNHHSKIAQNDFIMRASTGMIKLMTYK